MVEIIRAKKISEVAHMPHSETLYTNSTVRLPTKAEKVLRTSLVALGLITTGFNSLVKFIKYGRRY